MRLSAVVLSALLRRPGQGATQWTIPDKPGGVPTATLGTSTVSEADYSTTYYGASRTAYMATPEKAAGLSRQTQAASSSPWVSKPQPETAGPDAWTPASRMAEMPDGVSVADRPFQELYGASVVFT